MRRLHGFIAIAVLLVHGSSMSGDIKQYQRGSPESDDQFLVGVECNKSENNLRIGLFDAHNVPEQRMDLSDTFAHARRSGKMVP
jgi:hypothetical protein